MTALRVTTDLFASALLRRAFGVGGFGAVLKHGSPEAGAAFVILRHRDGSATLYGPASQTDYAQDGADERRFRPLVEGTDAEISARMEKEVRFDPDLWLVEIEPGPISAGDLLALATR